jgi:hypothetical protein
MNHKWNRKITKEKRFKTCERCGTFLQAGYPYIYLRPYTNEPFLRAGDCQEIIEKTKKFDEMRLVVKRSEAKRIQP